MTLKQENNNELALAMWHLKKFSLIVSLTGMLKGGKWWLETALKSFGNVCILCCIVNFNYRK